MRSTRKKRTGRPSSCSTLLRVGFTKPAPSPTPLVRSYRTVSALPVIIEPEGPTFHRRSLSVARPSGRPNLALASTLPSGAPTFLDMSANRDAATTRPPHHCGAEATEQNCSQQKSCFFEMCSDGAGEFVVHQAVGSRGLHHEALAHAVLVGRAGLDLNLRGLSERGPDGELAELPVRVGCDVFAE